MRRNVAILMGGWSAEREVSLVSGAAVSNCLKKAGFQVTSIDVQRDMGSLLTRLYPKPDVVFNALHGRFGEDGCVQGLLDILNIPYTHSGLLASALAMDKPMSKSLFANVGIDVAEHKIVSRAEVLSGDVMARPYVIKPTNEGSSVGVHIVSDGDRPLAVTEITTNHGFYDYSAKYEEGGSQHVLPADIDKKTYDKAMEWALLAHRTLGCRGVSRADFRYDGDKLYILEINTQPGLTPTSLIPEQAAHVGISFEQLLTWMVENAECDP